MIWQAWTSLSGNAVCNIINLEGLQYAVNLQSLDLYKNQISDISALSGLTNLQSLDLGNNQLSDISPLSSLINLQRLYLDDNQISDVSPLVTNQGIGDGSDSINLRFNCLFSSQAQE